MTVLADFLDRIDRMAFEQDDTPVDEIHTAGDLERVGLALMPLFGRMADRAGVDLDDLLVEVRVRVEQPTAIMDRRVTMGEESPHDAIAATATAAGVQMFLAGALWEQNRALPDLDVEP
jgi:hypothetical protein